MGKNVVLEGFGQTVRIEAGELVGYTVGTHECIHQKGSPGWRSSDTEMFPIIGPTSEANFQVRTPRGTAIQDQHGLLRELVYTTGHVSHKEAEFHKDYVADTRVANSKFPAKSSVEELYWPYDFRFVKRFVLTQEGVKITFGIEGAEGMPYMLGYHPAFKLHAEQPSLETKGSQISLEQVLAVGSRALQVADCDEIILRDSLPLKIRTVGFGHFMLWTEVPNMVCIEPITFYPYAVSQDRLDAGFSLLGSNPAAYQIHIGPL